MSSEEKRTPRSYFIIISEHLDAMYFSGRVFEKGKDDKGIMQYGISDEWTNRRAFATQFGKYELAERVAKTFRVRSNNTIGFAILEDVETYGAI